jgi:predicted dehydrogenase
VVRHKSFIIGCGKIAGVYDNLDDQFVYSHAAAYTKHKHVDIVGCWDLKIKNSSKLSEKYKIDAYDCSYIDAIKITKPDIVSICTPEKTHFEFVMSILESDFIPKIIFLEKPVCSNENQLNSLINASNFKDVKIVINHSRRFDDFHKNLKKSIKDDLFGKLIKTDVIYYGGWQHNGTHAIDTLQFLFDDEIEFEALINSYESQYENDPNLDFKCRFKKNQSLIFLTTMDEKYYQLFEFDFKFENARIRIEDFGSRLCYEAMVINGMQERVLVKSNYPISMQSTLSPMQSAVKKIVEHLESNISLDGHLINDATKTMSTIWKGAKWAN